jgi:hypothetical protein
MMPLDARRIAMIAPAISTNRAPSKYFIDVSFQL